MRLNEVVCVDKGVVYGVGFRSSLVMTRTGA